MIAQVREALSEIAADVVAPGDVIVGSRKVEYADDGIESWEFGVTALADQDKLDELLDGAMVRALHADRSLGGLVMDLYVRSAMGPRVADGRFSVEWLIALQIEGET